MARKETSKTDKNVKPINYTLEQPDKVTFEFLKSHLWSAADILRGSLMFEIMLDGLFFHLQQKISEKR